MSCGRGLHGWLTYVRMYVLYVFCFPGVVGWSLHSRVIRTCLIAISDGLMSDWNLSHCDQRWVNVRSTIISAFLSLPGIILRYGLFENYLVGSKSAYNTKLRLISGSWFSSIRLLRSSVTITLSWAQHRSTGRVRNIHLVCPCFYPTWCFFALFRTRLNIPGCCACLTSGPSAIYSNSHSQKMSFGQSYLVCVASPTSS